MTDTRPLVLICELTHRCPLRCAYCSNPRALVPGARELGTGEWESVLAQAAQLGTVQVHLTGGEPLLRPDLEAIARAAAEHGMYPTLVTSGLGGPGDAVHRVEALVRAGVRAVQVSFQDTSAEAAAEVAGRDAFAEKTAFAARVVDLGASLSTNFVLHRGNLARIAELIDLSLELGADRVELAHVQYHGWAELNRLALLPSVEQVAEAGREVEAARLRSSAALEIVYAMPDHFSDRPKPCMSGWGRVAIVVSPDGKLLPCHGAGDLPFDHETVARSSLAHAWRHGAAFEAFRGEEWMAAPCRGCAERTRDFGGCRCQALALTGSAAEADPACSKSPHHEKILRLRRSSGDLAGANRPRYVHRLSTQPRSSS